MNTATTQEPRRQRRVPGEVRILVILREILPLVLSLLRDRRRWILAGPPLPRSDTFHRRRADRLVAALARLGPTFVKLGQLFASRGDLLAEPYVGALGTLTDRVPPVPTDQVLGIIADSYGRRVEELFEWFDPEPLAAASLGQVHRARFRGREVVVKVLRPGIRELVVADIAAARQILGWVVQRFPNPHVRGLRAAIEEFAVRVEEEMDLRIEAGYAGRIRRNFAGHRGVRVPEVVEELVRERTLVLEYLPGTRIDQLDRRIAAGTLRAEEVIRRVLTLYVRMMLLDGLFHADPHPGNLLVDETGNLVLLDFGMVVQVSRERRRAILDTAFAAIRRDADGVVAGFRALGLIEPTAEPGMLRRLAESLLALAARATTTQERLQYLSEEILATLYDWPIVLPGDMVYFARTAALIEGLGIRYDARFNALTVATPILLELRPQLLRALRDPAAPRRDWAGEVGTFLGRATRILRQAGEQLALLVGERLVG